MVTQQLISKWRVIVPVIIISALFVFLVGGGVAFASYQGLPRGLPAPDGNGVQLNHLRLSVNTDESSSGANDYQSQLTFLVYTNARIDTPIQITPMEDSTIKKYRMEYRQFQVCDGGVATIVCGGVNAGNFDVNKGNTTITINSGSFHTSDRFDGYYVAGVTITLQDPPNSDYGNVMTFDVDRTNQATKFSVRGTNSNDDTIDSDNPPRSYGVPLIARSLDDSDATEKIVYRFGAPCDSDQGKELQRRIFWKGADSGQPINDRQTVSVTVRPKGSSSPVYQNSDAGASNGVYSSSPIQFKQGVDYVIEFNNVRDNVGSPGNAIIVWAPFDSAEYDRDCNPVPPPEDWQVVWGQNNVIDSSGTIRDDGGVTGDFDHPEYIDSPQPGDNLSFVHKASNPSNSSHTITDLRWSKVCNHTSSNGGSRGQCHNSPDWYLSDGYSNELLNMNYSPYSVYGRDAPAQYKSNAQNVHVTSTHSGAQDVGKDTPIGSDLYGYDASDPVITANPHQLVASDGGRQICSQRTIAPSKGKAMIQNIDKDGDGSIGSDEHNYTTSWVTSDSITSPNLCVNIPFYYNLTPVLTVDGGSGATVQQGDKVTLTGNINNPPQTGGRNHTNSESGKSKGIVKLAFPSGTAPANSVDEDDRTRVAQNPCDFWRGKASGSSSCDTIFTKTDPVPAGTEGLDIGGDDSDTSNLEVGTKLCYASYVNHPKNTESSDVGGAGDAYWSYSDIQCRTVVKSPKVQFINSDVTVGRYFSSENSVCQSSENAPIVAATLPTSRPSQAGSWAEYGAFATGNIQNFGTGAYPFGLGRNGRDGASRLAFGNTGTSLGGFLYGQSGNCLANPFLTDIDTNDSNSTTKLVTGSGSSISGDVLFDANIASMGGVVNVLDMTKFGQSVDSSHDKKGYVSAGKSLAIGLPPADIVGGSGDSGSGGATVGTYIVQQCTASDASAPAGWAGSRVGNSSVFTYSTGCNGANNGLQVKMNNSGPRNNGDHARWTFTSPSGTNLNKIEATRRVDVGSAVPYADPFAVFATNTGEIEICYRYANKCPASQTGNVSWLLNNASQIYIDASCRTNTSVRTTCDGGDRDTLYSLYDINLTINDLSAPNIVATSGSLKAGTVSGSSADFNYHVTDGGSGVHRVKIVAQDATGTNFPLYDQIADSNGGTCDDNEATTPTPCALDVEKTINVATSTLADGNYRITMTVNDKANSTTSQSWNITVTNHPALTDDYDGFSGRSIVIYAKKDGSDTCSPTSTGNIVINQDIIYKTYGIADVYQMPHITFMADCNITIGDNVKTVNASLVAGDAIKTCRQQVKTKDKCANELVIHGSVAANRLLLWRTYGADFSSTASQNPLVPAETFDLSPSQVVAEYAKVRRSAKPVTVREYDLPPRY